MTKRKTFFHKLSPEIAGQIVEARGARRSSQQIAMALAAKGFTVGPSTIRRVLLAWEALRQSRNDCDAHRIALALRDGGSIDAAMAATGLPRLTITKMTAAVRAVRSMSAKENCDA
ncbi:MAG: hypothetical protein EAZ99_07920 [Alphaproteobacteria bacterium]|nr:MAG: hypothetical protein EAZ99_07920 [Alphaproteobacteria bacterium]